jgi:hypothetical protein
MTGDAPWPSAQINAWLFARLAWNPAQDPTSLVGAFCAATFGDCSDDMSAYYTALERAFALALDIVPEQITLHAEASLGSLLQHPPTDMGDPAYAPLPILEARCLAAEQIPGLLAAAESRLEAARGSADPQAWKAEQASFTLARAWLEFDRARVCLYRAAAAGASPSETMHWLETAEAALARVHAWGEANLSDPRFRLNFRFTHLASWQMRLRWMRSRLGYAFGLVELWQLSRKLRYIYE